MREVRIVSPKEARRLCTFSGDELGSRYMLELAHTIATEPDRIRAAVAKALRWAAFDDQDKTNMQVILARVNALENGADL